VATGNAQSISFNLQAAGAQPVHQGINPSECRMICGQHVAFIFY